jgi:hypothetical protein
MGAIGKRIVWIGLLAGLVIAGASYPDASRTVRALVVGSHQVAALAGGLEDNADLAWLILLATLVIASLVDRLGSGKVRRYRGDTALNPLLTRTASRRTRFPRA